MKVGIDLVSISRLASTMAERRTFPKRVFSIEELRMADELAERRRQEFLAGRFAVKEAVLKALGTGISGGVQLTEVQTLRAESGAPVLLLTGKAQAVAAVLGLSDYAVSISHEGDMASAIVVLA